MPARKILSKTRKKYYDAYTLTEENAQLRGILDVTPFLLYFTENVYHLLNDALPVPAATTAFDKLVAAGKVTGKEDGLWRFVLSAYGESEFSADQRRLSSGFS